LRDVDENNQFGEHWFFIKLTSDSS
jgi:hypothetical protein